MGVREAMRDNEVRQAWCEVADLAGVLAYTEEFKAKTLSTNDTHDVEQQKVSVEMMSLNVYRVARVTLCKITHVICAFFILKFELIL